VIKWRLAVAMLMLVVSLPCAQAKQFAIVADKVNTTSNLTASELVKIFTAHNRTWPDGKSITVVMRDPSSADMQLVLRKLLNMTPEQAHAFVLAPATRSWWPTPMMPYCGLSRPHREPSASSIYIRSPKT
jgi:hypothetical protein